MIIADVYNTPNDTEEFIVARLVENELYFWGSFEDKEKANEVAKKLENAVVLIKQ